MLGFFGNLLVNMKPFRVITVITMKLIAEAKRSGRVLVGRVRRCCAATGPVAMCGILRSSRWLLSVHLTRETVDSNGIYLYCL